MKYRSLLFSVIASLLTTSCGDFLKEQSEELCYASNCADLNEVMIGGAYMSRTVNSTALVIGMTTAPYFSELYIMDDDATEMVYGYYKPSSLELVHYLLNNFYTYSRLPFTNGDYKPFEDYDIKRIYKHIGVVNVVLGYVDEFKDEPQSVRDVLRAECYFLRAAYHFLAANVYAKPYEKATASTDLCVPINITPHIEDKYFVRESMERVYNLVIEDLTQSIHYFQGVESSQTHFRGSEKAARALLARVYLYMGEWQKSAQMCESIISMGLKMQNLNGKDFGNYGETDNYQKKFYFLVQNPETIFSMGNSPLTSIMPTEMNVGTGGKYGIFQVSESLLNSYDDGVKDPAVKDLRLQCFFQPSTKIKGYTPVRKNPINNKADVRWKNDAFEGYLIRSSEVYLNKAEAHAMLGETNLALESLKKVMVNRYETGKMPKDFETFTGKKLVDFIRDERRKELCFECHRWFDLRRWAVCLPEQYQSRPSIRHAVYVANGYMKFGKLDGYYTLKPYGQDNAWVLPFPIKELEFNEGALIDNPERVERVKETE